MDDIVTLKRQVNFFIGPINCFFTFGDLSPNLLLLLTIVNLQSFVISDIHLLHSCFDLRSVIPTRHGNLISSKMNIIVCKCCIDVLHYFFNNIISFINCWIELTFVLSITINDDILKSFTSSPCLSVSWSVNFRN